MGMAPEALAVATPPTGHPDRCSTATLPNEVRRFARSSNVSNSPLWQGANVHQVTRAVIFQLCCSVDTIMWRKRCMEAAEQQRARRVADAITPGRLIFLDTLARECRSAMSERGLATVPVVVLTDKEVSRAF